MQRIKGRAFEQLVARIFKDFFPEAKRGIGQARSQSEVPDVENVPLMWIECKHGKETNWRAAMRQAFEELKKNWKRGKRIGWHPVVVTRDNGEPVYVHLELNFFLRLLALAARGLPIDEALVPPDLSTYAVEHTDSDAVHLGEPPQRVTLRRPPPSA